MRYLTTGPRMLRVPVWLEQLVRVVEHRVPSSRGRTPLRFQAGGVCAGGVWAGGVWASGSRPGRLSFRCEEGSVWITQRGEERDVVLRPGDMWTSKPTGKIVVQVLGNTASRRGAVIPVLRLV